MALHYISDAEGHPTAVIVLIEDWNALTEKYQELKHLHETPASPKRKPSDFRGTLRREVAQQLNEHVEQARKEWDRAS